MSNTTRDGERVANRLQVGAHPLDMTNGTGFPLPLRPLQRQDLVRGVVERMREHILAGDSGSSQSLPSEAQLGQALGVSRTVIREAMRILGGQGLVEVSQGRRPRIRPADPQAVIEGLRTFLQRRDHTPFDLIEVRRPLETAIASLAAERATPQHIQDLDESLRQLKDASGLEKQIEADLRFHDLLAEATGNPVFQLLLKTLASLMQDSRRTVLARAGIQRGVAGHSAILAAVRSHDPNAAGQAMLNHLTNALEDLDADAP